MDENHNPAKKISPVTIKEVQGLFADGKAPGKSKAAGMIAVCRDALGKSGHQILSVDEFCAYFGI